MPARSFFDTNVLVYSDDRDALRKQKRALALLEEARLEGSGVVSTQVLQEYFITTTRKLGVDSAIAAQKVKIFSRLGVVVIDVPDIGAAIDLHRLHEISFWDALIVRAAQRAECTILYTEDLQHRSRFGGVTIVDPFRGGA